MKPHDCCKLAIENGQLNLYMPDGAKVPEQIATTVVQDLDNALKIPRMAIIKVTMYVEVVDSIKPPTKTITERMVEVTNREGDYSIPVERETVIVDTSKPEDRL